MSSDSEDEYTSAHCSPSLRFSSLECIHSIHFQSNDLNASAIRASLLRIDDERFSDLNVINRIPSISNVDQFTRDVNRSQCVRKDLPLPTAPAIEGTITIHDFSYAICENGCENDRENGRFRKFLINFPMRLLYYARRIVGWMNKHYKIVIPFLFAIIVILITVLIIVGIGQSGASLNGNRDVGTESEMGGLFDTSESHHDLVIQRSTKTVGRTAKITHESALPTHQGILVLTTAITDDDGIVFDFADKYSE